ncbi:MAG: LysR family transcriptional regulator [Sneathiella sp.]|nr:LysR family transcriptional regulator [Sneathiella sp.]
MTRAIGSSLPPMEWLKSFEAAGRHGNFTAAGLETGLTQASVSQHIRALEDRLGVSLFRRLPRGVELTADGEAYLPHIQNALSLIKRGTDDLFGRPSKKITIAAPASIASLWIAPRLKAFSRSNPEVEVSISSIHRDIDYDAVESDFQIHYGNGDWSNLRSRKLFTEKLVPACAPQLLNQLKNKQEWQNQPLLAVKGFRDGWQEWAKATGRVPLASPKLRFDSFITALHAAESGAGILLCSLPLTQKHFDEQRLITLDKSPYTMPLGAWITWPKEQRMTRQQKDLIDILKSKPSERN